MAYPINTHTATSTTTYPHSDRIPGLLESGNEFLYDTETVPGPVCEAGTNISLFQIPLNRNGKTELDTNMTQPAVLPIPQMMKVLALYFLPPIKSTVDDRTQLAYNVLLEFQVNQKIMFSSPIIFLDQLDSEKLLFNEYDKFTQALIYPDLKKLVVNGKNKNVQTPQRRRIFGWCQIFKHPIDIGIQTPFWVSLKVMNPLELSQALKVSVLLDGQLWRAIT